MEDVRYLGTEELRGFFSREIIERVGYAQAVAEAKIIAQAAERGGALVPRCPEKLSATRRVVVRVNPDDLPRERPKRRLPCVR